jgi:hypothetical protein
MNILSNGRSEYVISSDVKTVSAFKLQYLALLESCLQTCMTYTIAECEVNKLLMMDKGTVRNT